MLALAAIVVFAIWELVGTAPVVLNWLVIGFIFAHFAMGVIRIIIEDDCY